MNVGELLPLPGLDAHRAHVEAELRRSVAASDPLLTEVASHLINAGGHRWRPTLAVASALAGGAEIRAEVVRGSCAVELVHLGSLYHDDVMDEAPTRRNVESVNSRWGNLVAVVAGDFLLARASEIAASLGTEIAGLLAATIGRLCEGQVLELKTTFQVDRSEAAYFESIAGKTASLLAASCRIGALCAELPRAQVEAVTDFGSAFGMVFQIVDDINDVVLSESELGKPAGHDMIEGVYTLPVLRALCLPEAGEELRAMLGGPIARPDADKARSIVRASGAVESAVLTARAWADQARRAVEGLPGQPARTVLANLGHTLLDQLPA